MKRNAIAVLLVMLATVAVAKNPNSEILLCSQSYRTYDTTVETNTTYQYNDNGEIIGCSYGKNQDQECTLSWYEKIKALDTNVSDTSIGNESNSFMELKYEYNDMNLLIAAYEYKVEEGWNQGYGYDDKENLVTRRTESAYADFGYYEKFEYNEHNHITKIIARELSGDGNMLDYVDILYWGKSTEAKDDPDGICAKISNPADTDTNTDTDDKNNCGVCPQTRNDIAVKLLPAISFLLMDDESRRNSTLKKTGQTKAYSTYDDGFYEKGVTSNYTRNTNTSVVTDHTSKLEWQDDTAAKTVKKNWEEAQSYCSALSLDGMGWRLPTLKELGGLSDYGRQDPAMNPVFVNTEFSNYWSITASGDNAWRVYFHNGLQSYNAKSHTLYVRCVR